MNLMDCIPRVAHPYSGNQPRFLSADKVQRLVDAVKIDNAIGRRNYAMILAAARLGLRGPEVISIQLEDIDWRAGEILIRGKGKYLDRMLLPVDAGHRRKCDGSPCTSHRKTGYLYFPVCHPQDHLYDMLVGGATFSLFTALAPFTVYGCRVSIGCSQFL